MLVQEYAPNGNLHRLAVEMGRCMTEQQARLVVLQPLLLACTHMHARGIIHRCAACSASPNTPAKPPGKPRSCGTDAQFLGSPTTSCSLLFIPFIHSYAFLFIPRAACDAAGTSSPTTSCSWAATGWRWRTSGWPSTAATSGPSRAQAPPATW